MAVERAPNKRHSLPSVSKPVSHSPFTFRRADFWLLCWRGLLLALALVPYHLLHSKALGLELGVTFAMYAAIGLGVTAGYHRLFSHRTYQANGFLRLPVFGDVAADISGKGLP